MRKTTYEKLWRECEGEAFDEDWKDQMEGEVQRMETESGEQDANLYLDSAIA